MARFIPLGVCPLPGIRHEIRQRVVPIGKTLVQFERLLRGRPRFGQIIFRIEKPAADETSVDVGEIGMRERVAGIGGDSPGEILTRFLPVLRPTLGAVEMPLEQQFVRGGVPRILRPESLLLAGGPPLQLLCNVARDFRHMWQVGCFPSVLLPPHL